MTFLVPLALLAGIGVGLPILAHLLSRYKVRRTDWAAMQFLTRSVRVRSRQIRLRDFLLLLLRCLVVALLVGALARPFVREGESALSGLGERRAGVLIALDTSFSMGYESGTSTRLQDGLERVRTIVEGLQPGDPITLVLLGTEHRVLARSVAYEPGSFAELLASVRVSPEALDLDSVPRTLEALALELDAHQKEIYLVTDMQATDWGSRASWMDEALDGLANTAPTTVVTVSSGAENLAITDLELVSGVLRKDSVARYRVTVKNTGSSSRTAVKVKGLVDGITVDTKTIPLIAAGRSEAVSLFIRLRDAGPVKISAELEPDSLPVDDVRRAVAVVREDVAVLCVQGSSSRSARSGELVAAALGARGGAMAEESLAVRSVGWLDLPSEDLSRFDVVVLLGVPDITPDQARALEAFVREGRGLIWFPGEGVNVAAWNERSLVGGVPLLPAVLEETLPTSDALGVGRPLDPTLPDHPVCRPLRSLPEDLLGETRFRQILQVKPAAGSTAVLTLAGTGRPVLLEHSLGRGQVFLFTTSSDSAWSNMAVTPLFPMVLQQMVTYLTAREFERPRRVGDPLSLSYVDQPDASEAAFDAPSGQTIPVPVRAHRTHYVALLESAREDGFYLARVSLQSPGTPIAVNVDTGESDVRCLTAPEAERCFEGTGINVARSEGELTDVVAELRTGRSLSLTLLLAVVFLLALESLVVSRGRGAEATRSASTGEVA